MGPLRGMPALDRRLLGPAALVSVATVAAVVAEGRLDLFESE